MFEKWFRYFKHIFIWLHPEFDKSLGSSTFTTKKLEWLDIQRVVENKDVSWNSTFSRWANIESREKIHRNRKKEKISITHGQLQHKEKMTMPQKVTEQCQSLAISICREHSMRACHGCLQWNFNLHFIFIVLSFSFML